MQAKTHGLRPIRVCQTILVLNVALLTWASLAGALSIADSQVLRDEAPTSGGAVSTAGNGGVLVSAVGQAATGLSGSTMGDLLFSGIPSPKFTPWVDGDNDHDGMPNGWEEDNDLDPDNPSDADEDDDDDGVTNVEEFQDGTDPQDPEDPPVHMPLDTGLFALVLGVAVITCARRHTPHRRRRAGRP